MALSEWPADKVERRSVATLIPHARNARTHSEQQIAQIAASIKEWGWTVPILVDDAGGIIAGHGRVMAAKLLGIAEVPAMVASGWTDAQKRAYVIADNKLALNAGWDDELLGLELGELRDADFDLSLIGFSDDELASLVLGESENLGGQTGAGSLAEKFGVPPFSVLNAREGWWQDRKAAWLALGIQSELGRGENLLKFSETINEPDPAKREARRKANGKSAARTFGQDLMRGEHIVGGPKRAETGAIVKGNGWGDGGPARRDAAFYAKKRAWEKANGRPISTTEFREKHWNGAA
jgi:hypothetical protein